MPHSLVSAKCHSPCIMPCLPVSHTASLPFLSHLLQVSCLPPSVTASVTASLRDYIQLCLPASPASGLHPSSMPRRCRSSLSRSVFSAYQPPPPPPLPSAYRNPCPLTEMYGEGMNVVSRRGGMDGGMQCAWQEIVREEGGKSGDKNVKIHRLFERRHIYEDMSI